MPGASAQALRGRSSGSIGRSVSIHTASLWPTCTGTRTQVAWSGTSASRIFGVSTRIFHSSLVSPSSRKTSMWGSALKAIGRGKTRRSKGSAPRAARVSSNSSSTASAPAPETPW